jgi:peptide/nickel transport system permease protein
VLRYAIRRLLWTLVVIVLISFITFVIYFVMPPNDSAWQSFTHGTRTAGASQLTRHVLGLDRPFWVQYGLFAKRVFLGDQYGWPGLWFSFQTRSALRPIIAAKAVVTAQLALGAAAIWLLVGIPLGVISALRPRSRLDRVAMGFALVGVSTPVFFLGTTVLYALWFKLHVAPGTGYVPIGAGILPWLRQMVLPWSVLAVLFVAFYARMGRGTLMEVLDEDYVRTARAKGLGERRVVVRHALRASLMPMVTMAGMDLGQLFGGAVITETVFNLPGLGSYAVQSVHHADLYAVLDITLVVAFSVTVLNLLVDLAYAIVDPRIRYG